MSKEIKEYTIQDLGQKVDAMDNRLEIVEKKLEDKFDNLLSCIIDLQDVVRNIENKIDKLTKVMERHIEHTKQEVNMLKKANKTLEDKMNEKINNFTENFEKRLQLLEATSYSLNDKPKTTKYNHN